MHGEAVVKSQQGVRAMAALVSRTGVLRQMHLRSWLHVQHSCFQSSDAGSTFLLPSIRQMKHVFGPDGPSEGLSDVNAHT